MHLRADLVGGLPLPSLVYVLPTSRIHGGIRVILEQAAGMAARGWTVTVVGPDPAPTWHPMAGTYLQRELEAPGAVPRCDVAIGSYYTTLRATLASGSPTVLHFCQGWEGVHPEHAPLLPAIDSAYGLPTAKLIVSRHLESVLMARYGCRVHFLGQAIDSDFWSPGALRAEPRPLRVGMVGPADLRPKGINDLLAGLALARKAGAELEIHHAAAEPMGENERLLGVTDRYFEALSTDGMRDFYRGLDAFVHPSWDEEGFPLPPLEAMACGVPTAVTAIRSFLPLPDEAVVRYPFGDPAAVPAMIAQLADPKRRNALSAAGRACAESYRLDDVLDRLEAAIAAEGGPSGKRR